MVLGYSIIAVPTGIVTAELVESAVAAGSRVSTRCCPECMSERHRVDARFCGDCGASLVEIAPGALGRTREAG